jgi:hypothetical protein
MDFTVTCSPLRIMIISFFVFADTFFCFSISTSVAVSKNI